SRRGGSVASTVRQTMRAQHTGRHTAPRTVVRMRKWQRNASSLPVVRSYPRERYPSQQTSLREKRAENDVLEREQRRRIRRQRELYARPQTRIPTKSKRTTEESTSGMQNTYQSRDVTKDARARREENKRPEGVDEPREDSAQGENGSPQRPVDKREQTP
ncbi:unnamed protein product, partial [Pleuronectes platessa]